MLRITNTKEKRITIWIPVIAATCAMHLLFFYLGLNSAESKPRTQYEPSLVEFRTVVPVEKPLPKPDEIAITATDKEHRFEAKEKAAIRTPKPNKTKTKPQSDQTSDKPKKAVFGVTADSVSGSGSGIAVRVGNTLEKEMEQEFTALEHIEELPPAPPAQTTKPEPESDRVEPIKPVPVYQLSEAPTFREKVEPKYPDEARREGIEGTVQLEILIDEKGRVRKIKVLKSPGYGFDRAAIAAVSKSKFNPGVINGKAVPVKIRIPYKFYLDV